MQVRTEWGVLPETEEQRRSHVLNRAIAEIEAGQEESAGPLPLADMQAEDASAIAKVRTLRSYLVGLPPHSVCGINFCL